MSPLGTACLDIFSPPPGAREVMTQVERLSSRDTKIALRSVRIAACSSGRGQRAGMVAPEWVVQPPHSASGSAVASVISGACVRSAAYTTSRGHEPITGLTQRSSAWSRRAPSLRQVLINEIWYEMYDVAVAAGERVLAPRVRAADSETLVLTNGFSCREQIEQGAGRKTLHVAELAAQRLGV